MTVAPAVLDVELSLGLAVTSRCCKEDLEVDPDTPLEELAATDDVVAKFVELRGQREEGQEAVQSVHGPIPVFSLHAGRFRAATCWDRKNQAVWLLASRIHRGGERSDSYNYFAALAGKDQLFPTEADYGRLFRRRNAAAVPLIVSRMRATLFEAREDSPRPQTVLLPGGVVVTVLVTLHEESEELPTAAEELWLSVHTDGLQPGWLPIIQAAITVDQGENPFEYRQDFPGRAPDRRELRFRIFQEVRE